MRYLIILILSSCVSFCVVTCIVLSLRTSKLLDKQEELQTQCEELESKWIKNSFQFFLSEQRTYTDAKELIESIEENRKRLELLESELKLSFVPAKPQPAYYDKKD